MRILVADQNSLLLAAISATFGSHCELVTASRRDACLAQVEQHKFDVVIACDKLADYSGLELLSEVPVLSPDSLLIFAADPKRLKQLGKRLAVFGLFDTLSYPLTPQKLVDVLKRARETLGSRNPPKVRHVVLESEWDTGQRLGLVEQELQAEQADEGRAATTHEEWAKASEVGAAAEAGSPAREYSDDDFVFEGPPPAVQAMGAPPRVDSRSRTFDAVAPRAGGAPESGANASGGRTFEGTPVAGKGSGVSRGSDIRASHGVTEYEVKATIPALTHGGGAGDRRVAGVGAELDAVDDFVFAVEPDPVAELADGLVELEAGTVRAGTGRSGTVGVAEESGPDELCSNDPQFDTPGSPAWAEGGAANDIAFEGRPLAPASWRRGGAGGIAAAASEPRGSRSRTAGLLKSSAESEVRGGHARDAGASNSRATASSRAASSSSRSAGSAYPVKASQASGSTAPAHASAAQTAMLADSPGSAKSAEVGKSAGAEQSAQVGKSAGAEVSARVGKSAAAEKPTRAGKSAAAEKAAQAGKSAQAPSSSNSPQPRVRTQSVPSPAQLAAFQRAVARRNEGNLPGSDTGAADGNRRKGGGRVEPTIEMFGGAQASSSLSHLAKMATVKRPLVTPNLNKGVVPKRAVFVVGSGLAAVLILGVLSFELLRNSNEAEHHMPHAQAQGTQIFSSTTTRLADGEGSGVAQLVAPPAPQQTEAPQDTPPNEPQAQSFDPDTAPPDPPPPPALENPGPMEPPSMGHSDPPDGMMPENVERQYDRSHD
jgi:hypothetical protein